MTPLPESLPKALVSGDGSLGGGTDPLDFLGKSICCRRERVVLALYGSSKGWCTVRNCEARIYIEFMLILTTPLKSEM